MASSSGGPLVDYSESEEASDDQLLPGPSQPPRQYPHEDAGLTDDIRDIEIQC